MGKTNDHAANQRLVVTCMVAENCHQKIVIMKIFLFKFFLYFLKKNHIGMAENCHRKKISYRHGRKLPLHTRTASYPGAF